MGRRAKQKRIKRKKGSSSSSGVEEDNPTRKIFKVGGPSEDIGDINKSNGLTNSTDIGDINKSNGLTNSTELSNLDVSEILQKANSVLFCDGEVF